ncbi:hypothetical protein MAPG_02469 [Magnaporthiopsis poae ATCC 64411]|uniref:Uncharacterized protein n=1 Tax=Magnaporthiopsis poae (strain ATCC 64411 / 73-15) TaxID=644358 RepID=A0A0C4DRG1_MAGP6|nr:hypothetical protein MAPG_02469 [Magnaporthiopsis poae ATCC 64411]
MHTPHRHWDPSTLNAMPHRKRQSRRVVVCEDCVRCDSSHHRGRPSESPAPITRREQQHRQYRDDQPRRHQTRGQDSGRASFVGLLGGLFKAAVGTVFGHESTSRSREKSRSRSRSRTASPSRRRTRRRDRSDYTSHYSSRTPEQRDERGRYRHRRRGSRDDGRRSAAEQQRRRSEEMRRRSRSEEGRKSELRELRRRERQWLEFWDPSTPPKCLFVRDPREPAPTRVEADRDSSRRPSNRAHTSQDLPHGSRARRPRSPSPRRPVLTEPVYGRRSTREMLPQPSSSPRQPSPRQLLPPPPAASRPAVVDRRASVVDVPDDPEDDAQDSAASSKGAQKHVHFDPAVMGQTQSQEASK